MLEGMYEKAYSVQEMNWCLEHYKEYKRGNIRLERRKVSADRLSVYDGFMYRRMQRLDYPDTFCLFIDNSLFMSITPMEIDSHVLPIAAAKGRVGVGGLGMGYYVQRILDKEEVQEVVVYEINKDVIAMYKDIFGEHPKLVIKEESALDFVDETFDFFYMDIYEFAYEPTALEHMENLTLMNNITHYHYWTMEHFIATIIAGGAVFSYEGLDDITNLYLCALERMVAFVDRTSGAVQNLDVAHYFGTQEDFDAYKERLVPLQFFNM